MSLRDGLPRRLLSGMLTSALSLAAGGCISTDLSSPDAPPLCLVREPVESRPVARVESDLNSSGIVRCSGVLISPLLLVTNLGCLVLPSDLMGVVPEVTSEPYRAPRTVHPNSADIGQLCAPDGAWLPAEDGAFRARLEEPVPLSTLHVERPEAGSSATGVGVRLVLFSGSASRCADAIAVVVLNSPLSDARHPIRLVRSTEVDQSVRLQGTNSSFATSVEQVTFELGTAESPPRSMVIGQPACARDLGGGVFAADTGALVGIVGGTTGPECDSAEGKTIANRLEPFKRLLLDAALESGEVLAVEADEDASNGTQLPDCNTIDVPE